MAIRADRVGVREDQVDIHGRVTSPSFLNELLEDLPEWTDMPVWVNGTEELLPSNNSVPVTSPILADIAYPDIRRDNQYFTYRESPTPVDGLAKIKSIKGNTLVWNQLVQNGNFADTSNWATGNATLSVASNMATLTVTNNGTVPFYQTINQKKAEHKVLVLFNAYASRELNLTVNWGNQLGPAITLTTSNQRFAILNTLRTGGNNNFNLSVVAQTGDVINYSNVCMFDLTKMGLDSLTSNEFTSLFSLPYYSYNQGFLLSFMGNGIKTVGFNQWNEEWEVGAYNSVDGSKADNVRDRIRNKNPIRINPSLNYYKNKGLQVYYYNADMNFLRWNSISNPGILTIPSDAYYMNFNGLANSCTTYNHDICINISDTERNGEYEPYTESTLSLPISTYFPTGMKSAGNVYDELTPTKAITRIGAVDLGSLDWTLSNSTSHIFRGKLTGTNAKVPNASDLPNALLANYQPVAYNPISANDNGYFALGHRSADDIDVIAIIDNNYSTQESFISHITGQFLFYELATPVELPTMSLSNFPREIRPYK